MSKIQLVNILFFSLVFGTVLLGTVLVVGFLRKVHRNFKTRLKNAKKLERLEANKCKGPHSWINMTVEDSKTHVCRDCYFSPKHDTFVKEFYVKEAIHTEQFESEYKKFFEEKIQEIVATYGISSEKIIEINKKVVQIKQDFSLQYLKKMIENLDQELGKKE